MTLEELIDKIKQEEVRPELDQGTILDWLKENFGTDKEVPSDFNKILEMDRLLTLLEDRVIKNAENDIAKIIIYAIALVNFKKDKIDIFKLSDELGIDKIETEE